MPRTLLGPSFYLLFAAFALLMFPLHESAHYFTYRLLGIHAPMTLNTASPVDQTQRKAIAELAGPLLNLAVAVASAVAYRMTRKRVWASLALAASMMRLVIYVLVITGAIVSGSGLSLGNDEPIAAQLWGLPSLTFVAVFAPIFVLLVWSIVRTFAASQPRKTLHVLGLGFTMLCIGVLVGNVLDPWLFPNR